MKTDIHETLSLSPEDVAEEFGEHALLAGALDDTRRTLVGHHVPPTDVPIHPEDSYRQTAESVRSLMGHPVMGDSAGGVEYVDTIRKSYFKIEMKDDNGQERPVYVINGRKIAMRTRWEYPSYVGYTTALAGETTDPTRMVETGTTIEDEEQWHRRYLSFVESQVDSDSADVLLVANTPEGVIEAVLLLSDQPDRELVQLWSEIKAGKYGERALALVDQIIGSMCMDDEGNFLDYVDYDAFPLVVAALAGVEDAQAIVDKRASAYMMKHDEILRAEDKSRREWYEEHRAGVEAVPAEEVCLVHSTSYEVELNDNGEVVLYSASQKRNDRYPRATIHFTPNCQVTGHAYASEGAWGDSNKLIVSNLKDMIDANGSPLEMSDVDTSYARNPGEALVLPNAVIIEPSRNQRELILENGNRVTYKLRADTEYTEEEKKMIDDVGRKYPGYIPDHVRKSPSAYLRECTLRRVMSQKGVRTFLTAGMHYGSDSRFQEEYGKLASQLGASTALHANTQESQLENDAALTFDIGSGRKKDMYVYERVSTKALRQVVASGYVPVVERAHKTWDDDFFF